MFRLLLYWELEMRTCVFVVFTSSIQKMDRAGTWDFMVSVLFIVQLLIFLSFFEGMGWGIAVLFSVP